MNKHFVIILSGVIGVVAVLWLLSGTSPQKAPGDQTSVITPSTLIMTGSSTLAPAMTQVARKFEAIHPGTHVEVATGGSERGIADTMSGLADIGMASRDLTPTETGLKTFTVGYDGVCLLVQGTNPVKALSDDQIRGIFTGNIRRWKEVGGDDLPITYIHRAEGRAERSQFMEHFKISESDVRDCVTVGDNGQAVTMILGNEGAIVYMSMGIALVHSTSGDVKMLPINGVQPSEQSVRTRTYPLVRPLLLVVKGTPTETQQAFIDFTLSEEGQACIRADHFVSANQ